MRASIWKRFINGEKAVLDELPKKIATSWGTCYQQGIDPYVYKPQKILSLQELKGQQRKNQDMIRHVEREIRKVKKKLQLKKPLFILTDEKGRILWRDGNHEAKDFANLMFFREGSRWTEIDVGTNAIGLALESKSTESISLEEHYSIASRDWSCAAAPIFDGEDKLVGILDISTYKNESAKEYLLLLTAIAQKVSNYLMRDYLEGERELLHYVTNYSEQEILCNTQHRIMYAPPAHQQLFEIGKDIRAYLTSALLYNENPILMDQRVIGYRYMIYSSTATKPYYSEGVLSRSARYNAFLKKALLLAESSLPIHIYGESGSGKEVVARMIHYNSDVQDGPLISVNCGAVSENLLESELFGYAPGAFTGANAQGYQGKIEQADGGSLFLDEIDSMPAKMQTALLRVLEDHQVTPISGVAKQVSFRLITASNKKLQQQVSQHEFREDLFYRIYVGQLFLPPLRERLEDIVPLIEKFCQENNWSITWQQKIETAARTFSWPGNIREFNNFLQRLYVFYFDQEPTLDQLNELILSGSLLNVTNLAEEVPEEKREIQLALEQTNYHATNTAKNLGISRATLYRKMKQYNIEK